MRVCLIALCVSFAFFACRNDQNSGSTEPVSKLPTLRNGYTYENHTRLKGPTAKAGQVVTIDFQIIDAFNNTLSDSRNAGIRPTIQMPEKISGVLASNPLLSLVEVMRVGDSATVYVPVDSLPDPPQEFRQSEQVAYHVKVLNIEDATNYMDRIGNEQREKSQGALTEAKQAIKAYEAGKFDDSIIEKNGGVKVVILNEANGVKANFNERVYVHYYGFLEDGKSFDNSYKVGKPYTFKLGSGRVIQGWDIAMDEISEGSTALIDIPFAMAYGSEGKPPIPPKSDLIFWVKVDKVEKNILRK